MLTMFPTVLGLLLLPVFVFGAPEENRVSSLPGFNGTFQSAHYSGYVTIDEDHGRSLYYYFVTSEGNPSKDPLLLWLNGGPGCSSFDGFVYEHGPFTFHPGAGAKNMPTLSRNPYTWAKVANIIYLDSPAGVGLSYSNNTEDYYTGDTKTAQDSHKFLLKWFKLYPEFLSNDFYVTGESYAGVYVPNLSQEIVNGIEAGVTPKLNFKGYMIGNGVTDQVFDGNALVPFVYGMGLISSDLYQEVNHACGGSYWNATAGECLTKLAAVSNEVADINVYDILEPCYHDPLAWEERRHIKLPLSVRKLGETHRRVRKRMFGRAWPLRMTHREGYIPSWKDLGGLQHVPCMDVHVANVWLNDPAVRKALHAVPIEVTGKWVVCSDAIVYYADSGSMIPIHKSLTSKGYRVQIFSGDHDMCVPYTGSEAWTKSLDYKVVKAWRPWFVDGQVAGYTVAYDKNLTFTTVKGSGHTVPEYKPNEALAMLTRWISGLPL